MVKKVREVIELLEADGWEFKRMRGDHRIYYKKGARRPIPIPGNLNDDLKDGTLYISLKRLESKAASVPLQVNERLLRREYANPLKVPSEFFFVLNVISPDLKPPSGMI